MKETVYRKLQGLVERYEEVEALLGDAATISDQDKFRALSKEYAEIEDVVKAFQRFEQAQDDMATASEMMKEDDPEMSALAEEEFYAARDLLAQLEADIQILMLPRDPNDNNNALLEIRAGTGGDEAAIFAGDLFRMYSRYAENKGWKIAVISMNEGEHGGYREIIASVSGEGVYGNLKFESGAHRVQRVPATESQGRIHTSACTVAILPELPEAEAIEINPSDLRIDTFRASGAGGQHVNKTDSAIRITHIPSGLVVECQDERSQHKNKAKALSVLSSRLIQADIDKRNAEISSTRRNLVGSGDRSERIRTYNYPQGRLTDHRINLTIYRLNEVMEGDLACVINPLVQENQADLLAAMSDGEY